MLSASYFSYSTLSIVLGIFKMAILIDILESQTTYLLLIPQHPLPCLHHLVHLLCSSSYFCSFVLYIVAVMAWSLCNIRIVKLSFHKYQFVCFLAFY